MSKTYITTDRVYYYPPNGAAPVFVADKGVEIPYELAERLGLVKEAGSKKVAPADVEDKKRTAPQSKKRTASADEE